MPQIAWPVRSIPCSTLALVPNSNHFYVRPADRNFLPIGQRASYRRLVGGNSTSTEVVVKLHDTIVGNYQMWERTNFSEEFSELVSPVASKFHLDIDAGLVVNYPSRPILSSPSLHANRSLTNPLRVSTYDAGVPRYKGSVELYVTRNENAGIVEAFIDQLHDQRNWFELELPGKHLTNTSATIPVSAYNANDGTITISIPYNAARTSIHDENLHGWWVRVGARTGRIVSHEVSITTDNTLPAPHFAYTHNIRITPDGLITGTYADNNANNFSNISTMRVRATSVSAMGHAEYSGAWVVEFEESDGL